MKGLNLEMGFAQFMEFEEGGVGSSGALNSFQWGGTIFALLVTLTHYPNYSFLCVFHDF